MMQAYRSILISFGCGLACLPVLAQAQFSNNFGPPVVWRTLAVGNTPLIVPPTTQIMSTPGQFETFLTKNFGSSAKMPADIQWGHQFVIAVVGMPQSGSAVQVQSIERTSAATATVFWSLRTGLTNASNSYVNPTTSRTTSRLPGRSIPGIPGRVVILNQNQSSNQMAPVGSTYEIDVVDNPGCRIVFQQGSNFCTLPGITYLGDNSNEGYYYTDADALPWQVLYGGWMCPYDQSFNLVITDYSEYADYCQTAFGAFQPLPPDFNWNTQSLVAIHIGAMPTAGISIQMDGIRKLEEGKLTIDYSIKRPGSGMMAAQHITKPFLLMRIEKTKDQIGFHLTDPKNPS